jgi:hypothetical protein
LFHQGNCAWVSQKTKGALQRKTIEGTTGIANNAQSLLLPVGKLSLFATIPKYRDDGTVAKHGLLFSPRAYVPVNKSSHEITACIINQGLKNFSGAALECLIRKYNLLASIWEMLFYLTIRKFDN